MARPRKNGGSGTLDGSVTADYRHPGVKRKNVPPAKARETCISQPASPSMEEGS